LCGIDTNLEAGSCSDCSFCALPSQTAFATIVYGTERTGGMASACNAVVLGQAIKSLEPARPRVVIVDSTVSSDTRAFLTGGGLWSIFESAAQLDQVGRKNGLWTLPFRRVFFMDADVFPIQGYGESRAERAERQRRFNGLWQSRGRLVATGDGKGLNRKRRCLNGGMMMLEPNQATASRLDELAGIQREIEESGAHQYPAGHILERCPMGHDMPPLNAAFKGRWSSFHSSRLVLGPLMKEYCTKGGNSTDGSRNFYREHAVYHAWAQTTPLDLGVRCLPGNLSTQGCTLKEMDGGYCQGVHNQYAREWWTAFNHSVPPPQRELCLRAASHR
jgi:hypothetical protein